MRGESAEEYLSYQDGPEDDGAAGPRLRWSRGRYSDKKVMGWLLLTVNFTNREFLKF